MAARAILLVVWLAGQVESLGLALPSVRKAHAADAMPAHRLIRMPAHRLIRMNAEEGAWEYEEVPEPDGGWEAYEWWEDGLSCVEYGDGAAGELRLGVYTAYSIVDSEPHIRPLCAADLEEGISCLFCDEDSPAIPISSVRRVFDPEWVYVSERQAGGGQGLGNPHGEHGEPCYDLSDVESQISADVRLVVREGRDTERVL